MDFSSKQEGATRQKSRSPKGKAFEKLAESDTLETISEEEAVEILKDTDIEEVAASLDGINWNDIQDAGEEDG